MSSELLIIIAILMLIWGLFAYILIIPYFVKRALIKWLQEDREEDTTIFLLLYAKFLRIVLGVLQTPASQCDKDLLAIKQLQSQLFSEIFNALKLRLQGSIGGLGGWKGMLFEFLKQFIPKQPPQQQ